MAMASLYGGATGGYRDATPQLRDEGSPDEPQFQRPLVRVNIETGEVLISLWPQKLTEQRLRRAEPASTISDQELQKLVEEHQARV
ncbi:MULTISPECIES: hypothetical protein [Limnochorda]|jgi:hypothetical protein|uniref:hypothetical protein n=1 Tax=Limnochorda TaxID=1676651 RepID=UPI0017C3EE8A|nr:hypothetical protein [Limnochorda pilosa]NMA71709.1 hypothetical protein [Bacillota bacterium]